MTAVAVVLCVCGALLIGICFGLGLPGIVSLGSGGLLILMGLLVMRYRRWLRRHPPGTDWEPSRGARFTLATMEVLEIPMNLGVIVLGSAVVVLAIHDTYRDVAHGDWAMILLWIVVLLVVGRTIFRCLGSLRRAWHRVLRARSSVKPDAS